MPPTLRPVVPDAALPHTLVIDVGGTGLKATVLDPAGHPEHDRVRVATTYPCPPDKLVVDLAGLVSALPAYQRVSVGFPGVVRAGRVLTAPHFITKKGPGSRVDPRLRAAWAGFGLADELGARLGVPVRVGNDADVQGAGEVTGQGLELVVTLGTGFGSAVFRDGRLALHLELAHHVAHGHATYNDYVGDAARKDLGRRRWNGRVARALVALDALIFPDAILVGGGNARRIDTDKLADRRPELAAKVRLIGNEGGLLGGARLWEDAGLE